MGIPLRILCKYESELLPAISRLFWLIIKTKVFPSSWKNSLVQPISKSGDCSSSSNYRLISITCSLSKMFEVLLNNYLLKQLEINLDYQYAFQKARSTSDLLSYVTSIWSSALRDFGESFIIGLNISKSFDRV